MDKVILHCDLNNFYASVEQKLNPELKGLPIAVSGNPEKRHGIILAKNYIAKDYGVQTGEAIFQAQKKCPNLVLIPPHFEEYVKISKEVHKIYEQYTDRVESFGIDECWLDVTSSQKLFGTGEEIAYKIKERVKNEIGLTISVGVSFTKILSKLGSDLKKPDAVTVLSRDNYMDRIGSLSPSEMIMIGRKTGEKLKKLNINTIKELALANKDTLRYHFGIIADNMINAANGIGDDEVKECGTSTIPKSISNGTTTPRDITNIKDATVVIYALAEMVANRLRHYNLQANGIMVSIRTSDLLWGSKQTTLSDPTSNASDIAEKSIEVLKQLNEFPNPLRTITIGAIRLSNLDNIQYSLFTQNIEKENDLEKSIDKVREKYGYSAVKRGVLLHNDLTSSLHEEDDFRPFHQSKDS